MAERLNAAVLKTVDLSRGPGVRIPLPPHKNSPAFAGFFLCGKDEDENQSSKSFQVRRPSAGTHEVGARGHPRARSAQESLSLRIKQNGTQRVPFCFIVGDG